MREQPILFSAPMVRAILNSRKTMTRRMKGLKEINKHPSHWSFEGLLENGLFKFRHRISDCWMEIKCPYGAPGNSLWVRETWYCDDPAAAQDAMSRMKGVYFKATEVAPHLFKWRPSIFMPRWASRITLEITGVRIERLKDISEEDAEAEGCEPQAWATDKKDIDGENVEIFSAVPTFSLLWDSINGKIYPWASNPWVWVIEFKKEV